MTASIYEVSRIIGQGATEELMTAYGGRKLYVPTHIRQRHPLALRLGNGAATLLAQAFGGDYIDVPTRRCRDLRERNHAILAEHAAGVSQTALANLYGLSRRQVYNILNTERQHA